MLAILALAVAAPSSWLPWNRGLHALATSWWMLPTIVSGLLLTAGILLPAPRRDHPDGPQVHRQETVALGLGLLLLLEPLLHLTVLALLAFQRTPGAEDLLLPGTPAASPGSMILQVGVLCVLAPLAEELFFRGRLLPWLADRLGRWSALSLTTLAFAVAHGSPVSCLLALPVGLVLGWLRLTHRDLGACVVVHQVHNGLILLTGPVLFTQPMTAAVLVGGGVVLLTLALFHGRSGWKALPAGLALGAALALALPPLLALKDRLWAAGTVRLLASSSADPEILLSRLDRERRRGRLTTARSDLLRRRLGPERGETALAVRLLLDGPTACAGSQAEAESLLEAAARITIPPLPLAEAAAAIGLAWPGALAEMALEDPAVVATWLGRERAPAAIQAAQGPDRRRLLAALEQVWPGRLGGLLLAMPATAVTPIDRRHLREHYPDAEELIENLDPSRRAAWNR